MGIHDIAKVLEHSGKLVFNLTEIATILGKEKRTAKVYVQRMLRRKLLFPVSRGIYSIADDSLLISTQIVENSYVSFVSALQIRHATTQLPSDVQVVVPKKIKIIVTGISFIKFPPSKIFGYAQERMGQTSINVAETEKAIADIAYRPRVAALHYAYDALESCNHEKVLAYAQRMSAVAYKRIGYMLDMKGFEPEADERFVKGIHKFNPLIKRKGKFNSKWKLYINEEL
jgi:predicted transcriptional regulator of viral defense system